MFRRTFVPLSALLSGLRRARHNGHPAYGHPGSGYPGGQFGYGGGEFDGAPHGIPEDLFQAFGGDADGSGVYMLDPDQLADLLGGHGYYAAEPTGPTPLSVIMAVPYKEPLIDLNGLEQHTVQAAAALCQLGGRFDTAARRFVALFPAHNGGTLAVIAKSALFTRFRDEIGRAKGYLDSEFEKAGPAQYLYAEAKKALDALHVFVAKVQQARPAENARATTTVSIQINARPNDAAEIQRAFQDGGQEAGFRTWLDICFREGMQPDLLDGQWILRAGDGTAYAVEQILDGVNDATRELFASVFPNGNEWADEDDDDFEDEGGRRNGTRTGKL